MPPASTSGACWRFAIPPLVANAGAAGARLSITLLRPAVVTLYPGHAFVLHDPVGLTGDRLLAALHRAATRDHGPLAGVVRWVVLRPPLAALWDEMAALDWRSVWRHRRHRWGRGPVAGEDPGRGGARRPARVAEPRPEARTAPLVPQLLLVSEAERADALPAGPAARLLARAMREEWAVFAVTRQGPAARVPDAGAPPAWRTHLICRSGRLRPVCVEDAAASPMPTAATPPPAVPATPAAGVPLGSSG